MKIFMDMDGVITNFPKAACVAHGVRDPYEWHPQAAGEYATERLLGMTANEFWKPLHNIDFWADMPWMPDGMQLLREAERLVGRTQICLLTCPTTSPQAAAGKMLWIYKNLPRYCTRFLIGPAKKFCAGPDAILIDDKDANITAFEDGGGTGILVPRIWNSGHTVGSATEYVSKELHDLVEELETWTYRQPTA